MSDFDTWTWGVVSAGAAARGRECFLLQPGIAPVKTGRFRIAWLDADGEVLVWWSGDATSLTAGWSDERVLVLTTKDEADAELVRALRSFGDNRDHRVEIMEMT